jgi:MEMO1 family protein
MPLVFSAISPHPPILIPNIGKEEIRKVEKTQEALEKLEQDLYISKPETLIILSSHASLFEDKFAINGSPKLESDFEQFGDFATKDKWDGTPELVAKIDQLCFEQSIPARIVDQEKLDHGSTVPLTYLTKHLPNIKIITIGYTNLSAKDHLKFGEILKKIILEHEDNIAVIASGDLSHSLTTESPAGFNKAGREFDEKIIELLESNNSTGIVNMDRGFVKDASECGYRSLLILLGILKNTNYTFKNYSYESPFGVGYLVGNFVL